MPLQPPPYPELPPSESPDFAKLALVEGFKKLLRTGRGSDLTITCNGLMFKVHKVILGSRSFFFAAACWGDFKEAKSNIINLPDENPELVKKMLEYLYALDYTGVTNTTVYVNSRDFQGGASPATGLNGEEVGDFSTQSRTQQALLRGAKTCWEALHEALQQTLPRGVKTCWEALHETLQQQSHYFDDTMDLLVKQKTPQGIDSIQHGKARLIPAGELAIHASMYSLADKYGIEGLKSTSVQKMTAALQGIGWDNRMEDFATAVAIAWTTTPASDRDLRTVLLDYSFIHVKSLVKVKEVEQTFEHLPQFAFDLLARLTAVDEEPIAPRPPPSAMSSLSFL